MDNRLLSDNTNAIKAFNPQQLLTKLTMTWEKRSQIKNRLLPDEITYEIDKPDFTPELIPIFPSKSFQALNQNTKNKILSYGWLAYNAKTIAIESKLIAPVCHDIIDGHVPGADDNESRKLIAETLTDESYHILLSHHAMMITEKHKKISRNIFNRFDLIQKVIDLEQRYQENWQQILIRLAVAIVSEIFISDYLKDLSYATNIATFNREITRSHRLDELGHSKIFTALTKLIYVKLSKKEKKFFSSILRYPVQYFASKELSIWHQILLAVCPDSANKIMEELSGSAWFDLSNIDYQNLILLGEEIGITHLSEDLANLT